MPEPRPVFIDCDPGLDDAIALMVLAAQRDVLALQGITTTAGNQSGEKTFHNARRLAAYLDLHVPVARGADAPLKRERIDAGDVHGGDGLAGMRAGDELAPAVSQPAVAFLYERLNALPEPAALLCVGPLTNVANLLEQHPDVRDRIAHLTIMGGSLSGGNVTPYAEFNFCADPDAADAVLCSGLDIRLLGLDVTHKAYLTEEELMQFAALGTRYGTMVGDLSAHYAAENLRAGLPGTPVHDASAVLYEAEPSLFSGETPLCLRVTVAGERMGECTATAGTPNVRYITGVDRERFVRTLFRCCELE